VSQKAHFNRVSRIGSDGFARRNHWNLWLEAFNALWSTLWLRLTQHRIEHGGVMAGNPEKHEEVPDRVLKPQLLPDVENDTDREQHASGRQQTEGRGWYQRIFVAPENDAAPSHGKVDSDRKTIEASGQGEFDRGPESGQKPDPDQKVITRVPGRISNTKGV